MIIDNHDGLVATVRMTKEEAKFLALCAHAAIPHHRKFVFDCPNVNFDHLHQMLYDIATNTKR